MYCPKCATPHADDVKFCRACGTELEAVALVLKGKSAKPAKSQKRKSEMMTADDCLEKRIESVSGITRGSILLLVSAIIGLAMMLFVPMSFDAPWILVWTVFFGWMAVWGGIEVAYGLSGVLEAKSRLRLIELKNKASDTSPAYQLPGGELVRDTSPFAATGSPAPVSITEGTTRHLNDAEG